MMSVVPRLVIAACMGALAACSPPTTLRLTMNGATQLNPDQSGTAMPVQVRVYLLKTATRFDQTDYFTLTDPNHHPLEGDVVSTQDLVLRPNQTQTLSLKLDDDSHVVAVSAAFQKIDSAVWHASLPVPDSGKATATLSGDTVSLHAD